MKAVLEFPDWCGSSWDSVDDCYEELHDAWQFPLLMIFRGFGHGLDKPAAPAAEKSQETA